MAKKKWLILGLLILVIATAVPIALFANSTQTKIEVDAEHLDGTKLQLQLPKGEEDGFGPDCVKMEQGQLVYKDRMGEETKIEDDLWSRVVNGSIEIYDKGGTPGPPPMFATFMPS